MPRYDFRCQAGHVTEAIFAMADVPEAVACVHCEHDVARRVFTAPTVHFRGSGFYTTDVTQKLHRKRRRNPGDDLHREFDVGTARIADAI